MPIDIEHVELPHDENETEEERFERWAEEERINAERADRMAKLFIEAHSINRPWWKWLFGG